MELRQIITFVRIVQHGSFSKAAESLGYTQSAVTIQIRRMEEDLGTRLFDRVGKNVTLTSQGSAFLPHAYAILQELNSAQNDLSQADELCGELRVGTIDSICHAKLLPILRYFRTRHPKVKIWITISSPEDLIQRMEHSRVDLIYILDEPRYSNNWVKPLERKEPVVLVASASLGLETRSSLVLEDLFEYPFFLTESNANYRRAFDRLLAARNRTLIPSLECSDTGFLIRTLKTTPGISLLPLFTVQDAIEQGDLAVLPVSDFHLSMYRQIFYHCDKWRSREMDEFIRLAQEEVQAEDL